MTLALDQNFRAVLVPTRRVGDIAVIARPADGAALVLNNTARIVWESLGEWCSVQELLALLEMTYPAVPTNELVSSVDAILWELITEGLVESPQS